MTRLWPGTSGGTVAGVVTQTPSQFRITIDLGGGETYELFYLGSGFTYDGQTATGGTYTQLQVRAPGGLTALASVTGLSQPLAGIYDVSLATLGPLAGNDTLTGSASPLSADVLLGGDGNDRITDTGGSRNIRAGAGDDLIVLGSTAGTTGRVDGGSGTDTVVASNLTGVTLAGVEVLQTQNASVVGTAAQFGRFATILTFPTTPTAPVTLTLAATGGATQVDLAAALESAGGPRRATIVGSTDAETVTTGAGADWLRGGGGDDVLSGGSGDDRLDGEDGNDTLNGGAGNDLLQGGAGDNNLAGGEGNDTLTGSSALGLAGAVTLNGGAGDDLLSVGRGGSGVINGGSGTDTLRMVLDDTELSTLVIRDVEVIDVSGRANVTARADQWSAFDQMFGGFGGARINLLASGAETSVDLTGLRVTAGPGGATIGALVVGSADDERMLLGGAGDTANGGDGDDTILGNAGNDSLDGGIGTDILNGGAGNDTLTGAARLGTLSGAVGNDLIQTVFTEASRDLRGDTSVYGGAGNDVIAIRDLLGGSASVAGGLVDGGSGRDTLVLRNSTDGLTKDITALTIRGIETLEVESIIFTSAVRALAAQLAAFDRIQTFDGRGGRIALELAASGRAVTLDLSGALDPARNDGLLISGSSDRETLFGSRFRDVLGGGGGNDRLVGRAEEDRLSGGAGTDTLDGGDQDDDLDGGAGNDALFGGSGADRLYGGDGNDTLNGGAGADVFQFAARDGTDAIEDFQLGVDRILFFGTVRLDQIAISNATGGARVEANGTTVIVAGVTAAQMRDADNFDFL